MSVRVAQLYEENGRPLARHRAVSIKPTHQGELLMTEAYDPKLRRSVRTAYLREAGTGADVLPLLRDAVVLFIRAGSMTITGLEEDSVSKKCHAQSWYIEAVAML